ncbi:hypothetical protein [Fluviicola taffensis]|uniref:Carboxypeptidase regulatory-like domain-containing protein n=1 Tax=Fluviicola taffensis (strain DSM 16823 / NCIMB 13979 / RW262) TaxID=755732 RepID=F2II97_FLUTR|nr:hypothetical protein [Fluviicola taffensis]AEA43806.1 hypothetical protein Fluta_1819 [Fluviicola taffensis DSM 16823]
MRLFLFTILILVSGCTKFGKTDTAKGRVLNPVTGEGISGVELKLLKSTAGLPGGNKAVKTVTTDGDGFYEISKAGLKGYSLSCNLPADYYPLGWFIDGELKNTNTGNVGLKKGKTLHADFYAVPYGEIKISIHNVNCQGPNDTLIYVRNYASLNGVLVFQPFTLTGCYDNNGVFAKVPSGDYSIKWTVIRNGISNSYSHILTVSGNGQAVYNIDY